MKRGFILGKFMPPHKGHLFMCEAAASMVDELTVLVCSTDKEVMSGQLRYEWMNTLLPHINIVHLHRDIPQEPEDHPDFWEIWKKAINECHPEPIDTVFGSESYVHELAKVLNAAPVIIDPNREIFTVSGSGIIQNPVAHWDNIPSVVRPYFQKRICLLGSESVGKSSASVTLANHFNTRYMPEYGRTYDEHHKKEKTWTSTELLNLAQTHIAMRDVLAPLAGPLLIEDTDIIQTAVWEEYLLDDVSVEMKALMKSSQLADHYILFTPDVMWVDDGVRYSGDQDIRKWFFDRAESYLKEFKLPYSIISGKGWASRTQDTIEACEKFFKDAF